MSFIDNKYFKDDIILPEEKYDEPIQSFIERYEPEILKKLFGYELYKLISADEVVDQRLIDLIDGAEYTVNDHTYKWIGLKNDENISLIAYYIYYWVRRNKISETTSFSEVENAHENAVNVGASMKIQNAWRRLQQLYGSVKYPDDYESCYAYMKQREEDYPEWIFTELGSVNAFDL